MKVWRRALIVLWAYLAAWAFLRPSIGIRAEGRTGRSGAEDSSATPEDDLKDAPNAALRYSLWNGPAAPVLLNAARAAAVAPLRSAASARRARAATEPALAGPASAYDEDGLFVSVVVDLGATPGEYRDAVAELGERAGLRLDQRFVPAFSDDRRTRVTVRGWVLPSRLGDLFGPRVRRVNVERSPLLRVLPDMPTTDILVGVRVPPGTAASVALEQAVARLSESALLHLRRVVGYQMIPGTSQSALILSARVPVPYIERVLRDPAVVKIVPSPDAGPVSLEDVPERESVSKKFLDYAATQRPGFLIGMVLLTLFACASVCLRSKKE